jgi:tRNA G18 (ribose-2'-O)-methylase SpoU
MKGYFGIGIYHNKYDENIGTLFRSGLILGASFIFTIGKRYGKQCTDTPKSWRQIPLYHYKDTEDFLTHIPISTEIVGIEMDDDSIDLKKFEHPHRAIYLLGAEDYGIPEDLLERCDHVVRLYGEYSMNVSVAGSIVMYDRLNKSM